MPTVGMHTLGDVTLKTARRFVFLKRNWADAWRFVPWIEPLSCRTTVAPDVSSCDLSYAFGNVKREHASTFAGYLPVDLRDWYV